MDACRLFQCSYIASETACYAVAEGAANSNERGSSWLPPLSESTFQPRWPASPDYTVRTDIEQLVIDTYPYMTTIRRQYRGAMVQQSHRVFRSDLDSHFLVYGSDAEYCFAKQLKGIAKEAMQNFSAANNGLQSTYWSRMHQLAEHEEKIKSGNMCKAEEGKVEYVAGSCGRTTQKVRVQGRCCQKPRRGLSDQHESSGTRAILVWKKGEGYSANVRRVRPDDSSDRASEGVMRRIVWWKGKVWRRRLGGNINHFNAAGVPLGLVNNEVLLSIHGQARQTQERLKQRRRDHILKGSKRIATFASPLRSTVALGNRMAISSLINSECSPRIQRRLWRPQSVRLPGLAELFQDMEMWQAGNCGRGGIGELPRQACPELDLHRGGISMMHDISV